MSADVVTLREDMPPLPAGRTVIRVVLDAAETKLLDDFSAPHGISRDDAAGRMLRAFLRARAAREGNGSGR